MRQHMRRFTRLRAGHSKKFANHCHALALYFAYYNFVERHNTLRCTPAIAAGVERDFWKVERKKTHPAPTERVFIFITVAGCSNGWVAASNCRVHIVRS